MNKSVYLVVEGLTEQLFCAQILAPYLATKGIYLYASLIRKKGCFGGDVRFARAKASIVAYFKQRPDTLVGTFIDYYGLKEWPGLDVVRNHTQLSPIQIAEQLRESALTEMKALFPNSNVESRFVPFVAVHEFEALLFSAPSILASAIGVREDAIRTVVTECGGPEGINNKPQTAPSKRIVEWASGRYAKTTQGIAIAKQIGISKMREQCPVFDSWLKQIEEVSQ